MLALILGIIVVALIFDFLNGFHDAANSIATVVSTRVLTPTQAVLWAAFFNFVAAFVFGTGVAKTIGAGLVKTEYVDVYVVFGGLSGAIAWNILTWFYGIPSSSSHALVGGIAGAAITKAGWQVILFSGWTPLLLFIILSPLIGMILGALFMLIVTNVFFKVRRRTAERTFRRLQLLSAAIYSLGHGGNDAQKTMGIIVMLLVAGGYKDWTEGKYHLFGRHHEIALWIILVCHFAIALGTVFGGWRIVKTMGQKITQLQPIGGFCAETAAATTIIGATLGHVPISTTHAITGAILGVGTIRGVRAVRWDWGEKIVWAWILTIPCSGLIAAAAFLIADRLVRPFFVQ
ncbi:Low-affinity inorganic phosphate transporter 1 [Phycisphaerae bacterium RAS2]|nr:Low-affinity inorganic phosphate transporter 1 [Phycisphaerae bacterium RAS2]